MSNLTTAHRAADERDASISWLRVKLFAGTAGLDPADSSVLIVEVPSPDRAWRLELIGYVIDTHPWVHPDLSTCIRVRALVEADVRLELGLDGPCPPVLLSTPLASRAAPEHDAPAQILEFDRARNGRRYPR